jgi:prephenate dehydrogenase
MIRTLAVVGAGLIGTSVALAARRRGVTVYLADRDESAARTAAALGAGLVQDPAETVDLAVLAVPPSQVATVLAEQQSRGLALSYTDVAGVKAALERAVLDGAPAPDRFVGGHPLAGRERSGPLAAAAGLFQGRPWVLTPSSVTSRETFDRALHLARLCGGVPVVMDSEAHDAAAALISHVPHAVASLMAARLLTAPAEATRLAGQGLRDVTRIAGGRSQLWSDIFLANAAAIASVLTDLQADLTELLTALTDLAGPHACGSPDGMGSRDGMGSAERLGSPDGTSAPDNSGNAIGAVGPDARAASLRTVSNLFDRGIAGRGRIAARGRLGRAAVHVRIADRPGELTRLLAAVADLGLGPDDAVVGPGDLMGGSAGDADGPGVLLVGLAVDALIAAPLVSRLGSKGWDARPGDPQLPPPGLPVRTPELLN